MQGIAPDLVNTEPLSPKQHHYAQSTIAALPTKLQDSCMLSWQNFDT